MPDRFVILHHRLKGGEHWDLMLEQGDVLCTWRLARDPLDPRSYPIEAERIGDHRKEYLTYQGPISEGRGEVQRVDEGTYVFEADQTGGLRFRMVGTQLRGLYQVATRDDGSTVFASVPRTPA